MPLPVPFYRPEPDSGKEDDRRATETRYATVIGCHLLYPQGSRRKRCAAILPAFCGVCTFFQALLLPFLFGGGRLLPRQLPDPAGDRQDQPPVGCSCGLDAADPCHGHRIAGLERPRRALHPDAGTR